MADGVKVRSSTAPDAVEILADQVTVDGDTGLAQRVKLVHGAPGSAVDASDADPLPVAPSGAGDVVTTLTDGRKTVAAPGTAVALRAALACKWVCVTALAANTDQVNVGGEGVIAAGASTGTPLAAGDSVTIPINDASKVFVDARVAGEGVSFTVGS